MRFGFKGWPMATFFYSQKQKEQTTVYSFIRRTIPILNYCVNVIGPTSATCPIVTETLFIV